MEEFDQGGISRRDTIGSASTRPSAAPTSTRSLSRTVARERICSSASSTVSTAPVYLQSLVGAPAPPAQSWPRDRQGACQSISRSATATPGRDERWGLGGPWLGPPSR